MRILAKACLLAWVVLLLTAERSRAAAEQEPHPRNCRQGRGSRGAVARRPAAKRAPQTAPSGAVMMKVVGKTPGGVGYVDGSVALDASVKVIARIVAGQVSKP